MKSGRVRRYATAVTENSWQSFAAAPASVVEVYALNA